MPCRLVTGKPFGEANCYLSIGEPNTLRQKAALDQTVALSLQRQILILFSSCKNDGEPLSVSRCKGLSLS